MYRHYHEVYMRSVRDKWKNEAFLRWAAERFQIDPKVISLQTPIPTAKLLEDVIDYLVWQNCSIDRGQLPKDRLPTLAEVQTIFSYHGGD